MEKVLTTEQALNELRSQVEDSPILDIVSPLFETLENENSYYPNRVSEKDQYTQLFWQTGELANGNYELICLTLAKASLSMTIALNHRHDTQFKGVPMLSSSASNNAQTRLSMIVDSRAHILFETNPIRGVPVSTRYDEEAIASFTPELNHSLAVMGLYGYDKGMRLKVS